MTVRSSRLAFTELFLLVVTAAAAPVAATENFGGLTANETSNESPLSSRSVLNKITPDASGEQIKWQPAMEYYTDSCYNIAAIDSSGNVNGGQDLANPRSMYLIYVHLRLTNSEIAYCEICYKIWQTILQNFHIQILTFLERLVVQPIA